MYCSKCGKQISDQANFCNYCGAKVTAPQPPRQPQQPVYTPPSKPAYTPPQQNTYTAPAQSTKKEGVWGKRIVTALVAVAVYFGAKYATQAFLTRDLKKPEPTTSNSGLILSQPQTQAETETEVSLTDSCFYGALYQYDHVTYGLTKMHLPGYYLLPGEGDERDWLMSGDDSCLFYAYKQLEFNCSFDATDEASILSTTNQDGSVTTMVDFQKYYLSGYPVIRYIAHYTDAETDQYIAELIIFPSETANETIRLSMFQLAETGYDKINQAFDTLTISPDNAVTYNDTGVMGLNRITVK